MRIGSRRDRRGTVRWTGSVAVAAALRARARPSGAGRPGPHAALGSERLAGVRDDRHDVHPVGHVQEPERLARRLRQGQGRRQRPTTSARTTAAGLEEGRRRSAGPASSRPGPTRSCFLSRSKDKFDAALAAGSVVVTVPPTPTPTRPRRPTPEAHAQADRRSRPPSRPPAPTPKPKPTSTPLAPRSDPAADAGRRPSSTPPTGDAVHRRRGPPSPERRSVREPVTRPDGTRGHGLAERRPGHGGRRPDRRRRRPAARRQRLERSGADGSARAADPGGTGDGSGGSWGPMSNALATLRRRRARSSRPSPSHRRSSTTGGVVVSAMAFGVFGRRRRDGEPPAPDEVLAAEAALGISVAMAGLTSDRPGPHHNAGAGRPSRRASPSRRSRHRSMPRRPCPAGAARRCSRRARPTRPATPPWHRA